MLLNDRYLRALAKQPVDRTPVWLMRQAGRYLPEYRAVRAKAGDFMSLCRNPELCCEVTLQPLDRFPLDAAILFSDILTIPDAMGLGLSFGEGEGPRFARPLRSHAEIAALGVPDPEQELRYVTDAVRVIRSALNGRVPLIGFAGSPWTLATYMVEGGSSKSYSKIKAMLFDSSHSLHLLLDKLAESVRLYLNAQVEAGAQALMIFDTWGSVLTPAAYREFSLNYMRQIVSGLTRSAEGRPVPVTLFTKGAGLNLTAMADVGADALGVDWTLDLAQARELTQGKVALQGNVDPCILYASPERIQQEVAQALASYGHHEGLVFNLGHGLLPDLNPDHVGALVQAVQALSPAYHRVPA